MSKTDAQIHAKAAIGFGRAADAYERGRPEYPEDAIQYISNSIALFQKTKSDGRALTAADIAAGTGKFTKILAALDASVLAEITAVEPVAAMRAKCEARALPRVCVTDGTAEKLPFGDQSLDVVTVAQAFHWFDGARAVPEIHRVLRPNGLLCLIWNVRDESVPWVREMTELMEPYQGDAPRYRSAKWREAFDNSNLFSRLEPTCFRHINSGSIDVMIDRVASVSFISSLPEGERASLLDRMHQLYERVMLDSGRNDGCLEMPYETHVFFTARTDGK